MNSWHFTSSFLLLLSFLPLIVPVVLSFPLPVSYSSFSCSSSSLPPLLLAPFTPSSSSYFSNLPPCTFRTVNPVLELVYLTLFSCTSLLVFLCSFINFLPLYISTLSHSIFYLFLISLSSPLHSLTFSTSFSWSDPFHAACLMQSCCASVAVPPWSKHHGGKVCRLCGSS